MKKMTVASLCEHISKMNLDFLDTSNKVLDLEKEVKFLKSVNLYTSVAGVIILIVLGFICYSMV